ncbi:MAG: FimV/HubP family polar landmark protein [Mariprofundaceae bacterium]|nr:FimV/HubP family polar landmark protein [Mariprofundaceae bacterium]
MYRHIMHVVCAFALSILSFTGMAQAVSLGKIDVASHLGEPFYAEVPLGLDDGESIANVFVSLATASDYRLLEVFHDQAVDVIKVNVKRDQRGGRVELTTVRPLDLPFFNVIMKVKQGRATHFKKFSVFLDLPKSSSQVRQQSFTKRQPQTEAKQRMMVAKLVFHRASPIVSTQKVKSLVQDVAKSRDRWARTQRYGPMVFGDTITTVAQRLRVDQRFSNQQVMLALFEKNKSKFSQNNINLIKAGTYLDVPTADEVMLHSDAEAIRMLHQQAQVWKKLTQQSQYAKVKEAQKNRYAKHVSIGEHASGVAKAALVAKPETRTEMAQSSSTKGVEGSGESAKSSASVLENATIILLQKENEDLKKRLNLLETTLAKMASKTPVEKASAASAASAAQVNKLQIQLARQNNALEKARQKILAQQEDDGGFGLLAWILMAVVTLLSIVVGYLVYMLKGQRKHPAQQDPAQEDDLSHPVTHEESDAPAFDDSNLDALQQSAPADAFEGIPDLTDEDTSEMEAFQNPEEEPDPNVDYLSEADVYTRYGMDDEAEKQVNMALRLREDNKDAHVKRVEIRHARGDHAGVKDAVETAKLALTGSSLALFMTAYEALGSDGVSDDEVPATSASDSTTSEDLPSDMEEFDLPDLSGADDPKAGTDELDLGEMDWSGADLDLGASLGKVVTSDQEDDGLEFTDLDLPTMGDHSEADVDLDLDAVQVDDGGLDFSGLNIPNMDSGEDEHDATVSMAAPDALNLDDSSLTDLDDNESPLLSDSDDVLGDIDLSSFDLTENEVVESFESIAVNEREQSTPTMSNSEGEYLLTEFSGLNLGEFDEDTALPNDKLSSAKVSSLTVADEMDDLTMQMGALDDLAKDLHDDLGGDSSLDLDDFDDLDIDLDAVDHDADLEEFTSTIQATLKELGVEDGELDAPEVDDMNIHDLDTDFDDLNLSELEDGHVNKKDGFEASLELDNLLSELDDFSKGD